MHRTRGWIDCGLAAAVVAAYLPVLRAGFLGWDDNLYVTENPQVQGLTLAHQLNNLPAARRHLERAVRLAPSFAEAHNNRASSTVWVMF